MAVPVVRLLVLGLVRLQGQAHGYALHRQLGEWHVETWTSVKPGSIYHALKQLTKEGKLQELGFEDSPQGPGRTRYQLTPAGEAEFSELLEAALGSFALEELGAGVAFMQALPRGRAIALLADLHTRATANRQHLDALVPGFPDRDAAPHMQDLLHLWSGNLAATASWAAGLVQRLRAGDYRMADTVE